MTNHDINIRPFPTTAAPIPSRRTRLGAGLAAVALTAGLAACGDDASDGAAISPAACDAAVALGSAMSEAPEDPSQFSSFAETNLVPIGDTLVEELDGDAEAAGETLQAAYQSIAETGDPSPLFEDPAVSNANGIIGKLVHDECDVRAVEVEAIEYAFVGAPDEVKAGRVSFAFENKGVEEHEMIMFRRNDGVTESLDDLLQLPEEESMSKVTFTGASFGAPGTTNYSAIDMEPGTYFLVCFIPQGGEDGAPHFMGGMKHTLTVS